MSTRETLEAARALIDSPEKWCQGRPVKKDDEGRTRFCSIGALGLATGGEIYAVYPSGRWLGIEGYDRDAFRAAQHALYRGIEKGEIPRGEIPTFNDTHTHDEVLAMFDLAIAKAWQEETGAVEREAREMVAA